MLRACVGGPLCAQSWAMSTPSRAQCQNVLFFFRTWCITPESGREAKKNNVRPNSARTCSKFLFLLGFLGSVTQHTHAQNFCSC